MRIASQRMEIERVNINSDTPGQEFSLRVLRFRGSGNGPAVYLQAALHAHEMPGMVALDRLIPLLDVAENEGRLSGSITVVPHANPIGLAQVVFGETLGRFDLNSRVNYNRSFPSDAAETMAGRPAGERLKATLLELATQADIVLDLHCDDEGPIYLYVPERKIDDGLRLARAMQAAFILTDSSDAPVSFDLAVGARWSAERNAESTRFAATIELRGMLDVTPSFAEQDAAGLYRYLVYVGTIIDELSVISCLDPIVGDIDDAQLLSSPVGGAVLYDVAIGDKVTEGQRLATIVSEPGNVGPAIRSPFDGRIMTRRDRRFVRRGDDVIKVLRHKPG